MYLDKHVDMKYNREPVLILLPPPPPPLVITQVARELKEEKKLRWAMEDELGELKLKHTKLRAQLATARAEVRERNRTLVTRSSLAHAISRQLFVSAQRKDSTL